MALKRAIQQLPKKFAVLMFGLVSFSTAGQFCS